jgi:Na+/phosphate symporter
MDKKMQDVVQQLTTFTFSALLSLNEQQRNQTSPENHSNREMTKRSVTPKSELKRAKALSCSMKGGLTYNRLLS